MFYFGGGNSTKGFRMGVKCQELGVSVVYGVDEVSISCTGL